MTRAAVASRGASPLLRRDLAWAIDSRVISPNLPKIRQPHRFSRFRQRLVALRRGAGRSLPDYLFDQSLLRGEPGTALADRLQEAVDRGCQLALYLHIAHCSLAVAVLEVCDLSAVV